MKFQIFITLIFSSIILSAQKTSSIPLLSYPISVFNSDTCCWRKLSNEDHNEEAAQLILMYYQQNKKSGSRQPLYWHAGQCFAFAGENEMAIRYMKKTYSPIFSWLDGEDGKTWYYYARGTVAFLNRDKKKLSKMISTWEDHYPQNLNYKALLQLQDHWELPYHEINRKAK